MIKKAQFSACRTWRYTLSRWWGTLEQKRIAFIGLNPSTADESKDDPTIRRCIGYAKAWGYGGLHMLNLFAFRATDPKKMKLAADPIGPDNDLYIKRIAGITQVVVAAWGGNATFLPSRSEEIVDLIGERLTCLGKTKGGHPKHPLYLKRAAALEFYP